MFFKYKKDKLGFISSIFISFLHLKLIKVPFRKSVVALKVAKSCNSNQWFLLTFELYFLGKEVTLLPGAPLRIYTVFKNQHFLRLNNFKNENEFETFYK